MRGWIGKFEMFGLLAMFGMLDLLGCFLAAAFGHSKHSIHPKHLRNLPRTLPDKGTVV